MEPNIAEFTNAIDAIEKQTAMAVEALQGDIELHIHPDRLAAAAERLLDARLDALRGAILSADRGLVAWEAEQQQLAAPPSRSTSEQNLHAMHRGTALAELTFVSEHGGLRAVLDRARVVATSGSPGERECWDTHLAAVAEGIMPRDDPTQYLGARMELDEVKEQLHRAARTEAHLQVEEKAHLSQEFRARLHQEAVRVDAEDARFRLEKRRDAMKNMTGDQRDRFLAGVLTGQTPDPANLPVNK